MAQGHTVFQQARRLDLRLRLPEVARERISI
jgi:hypothetical protein